MVDLINKTLRDTKGLNSFSYDRFVNSYLYALAGNDVVTIVSMESGLIDLGPGNDSLSIEQFSLSPSASTVTIAGGLGTDKLTFTQFKAQDFQWRWSDGSWELQSQDGKRLIAFVGGVEGIEYSDKVNATLSRSEQKVDTKTVTLGRINFTGTSLGDTITGYQDYQTSTTIAAGDGNDLIKFYYDSSKFSGITHRIALIDGGNGSADTFALYIGSNLNFYDLIKFEKTGNDWFLRGTGTYSVFVAKLVNIENIALENGVVGTLQANGINFKLPDSGALAHGSSGADTFTGGKGNDTIRPGSGDDYIDLRAGGSDVVSINSFDYSDSLAPPLSEVTIVGFRGGTKGDDKFSVMGNYWPISDTRKYNANTGLATGDVTIGWDNGAKTIFHFKAS